MNVSDTPWSNFKESDYTIEQWRKACLISPPEQSDSKADYKLPVREPSGALNRNGCHAAAAALAGARGGITSSPERKKSAAKKLVLLYRNDLEEAPPEALLKLSGEIIQMSENNEVDEFLAHYGVIGMKWGKRKGGLKSRIVGARLDANQRRLTTARKMANGEAQARDIIRTLGPAAAIGTIITPGVGTAVGVAAIASKRGRVRRVQRLEAQKERIERGEVKVRDIVDFMVNVPTADLFVSRRDVRGED